MSKVSLALVSLLALAGAASASIEVTTANQSLAVGANTINLKPGESLSVSFLTPLPGLSVTVYATAGSFTVGSGLQVPNSPITAASATQATGAFASISAMSETRYLPYLTGLSEVGWIRFLVSSTSVTFTGFAFQNDLLITSILAGEVDPIGGGGSGPQLRQHRAVYTASARAHQQELLTKVQAKRQQQLLLQQQQSRR